MLRFGVKQRDHEVAEPLTYWYAVTVDDNAQRLQTLLGTFRIVWKSIICRTRLLKVDHLLHRIACCHWLLEETSCIKIFKDNLGLYLLWM